MGPKGSPRCPRHDVIAAYIAARHHSENMVVHRNDLGVREGVAASMPQGSDRRVSLGLMVKVGSAWMVLLGVPDGPVKDMWAMLNGPDDPLAANSHVPDVF